MWRCTPMTRSCFCQPGPAEYVAIPVDGEYLVRVGVVTKVSVDEIHGELVYCYGDFDDDEG